jgi:hypothetical protein
MQVYRCVGLHNRLLRSLNIPNRKCIALVPRIVDLYVVNSTIVIFFILRDPLIARTPELRHP